MEFVAVGVGAVVMGLLLTGSAGASSNAAPNVAAPSLAAPGLAAPKDPPAGEQKGNKPKSGSWFKFGSKAKNDADKPTSRNSGHEESLEYDPYENAEEYDVDPGEHKTSRRKEVSYEFGMDGEFLDKDEAVKTKGLFSMFGRKEKGVLEDPGHDSWTADSTMDKGESARRTSTLPSSWSPGSSSPGSPPATTDASETPATPAVPTDASSTSSTSTETPSGTPSAEAASVAPSATSTEAASVAPSEASEASPDASTSTPPEEPSSASSTDDPAEDDPDVPTTVSGKRDFSEPGAFSSAVSDAIVSKFPARIDDAVAHMVATEAFADFAEKFARFIQATVPSGPKAGGANLASVIVPVLAAVKYGLKKDYADSFIEAVSTLRAPAVPGSTAPPASTVGLERDFRKLAERYMEVRKNAYVHVPDHVKGYRDVPSILRYEGWMGEWKKERKAKYISGFKAYVVGMTKWKEHLESKLRANVEYFAIDMMYHVFQKMAREMQLNPGSWNDKVTGSKLGESSSSSSSMVSGCCSLGVALALCC